MRNVPGEGDCMFLAVALAAATSMGLGGNDALLRSISRETRRVVATVLQGSGNLHIEKNRFVPASRLLQSAARQERTTPDVYLERLQKEGRDGGLYGGGPELTVLSNVLRRPISIYELLKEEEEAPTKTTTASSSQPPPQEKTAWVKCVGTFGDIFRDPCAGFPDSAVLSGLQPGAYSWHLHILVLDMNPTEKHACVLLPQFL